MFFRSLLKRQLHLLVLDWWGHGEPHHIGEPTATTLARYGINSPPILWIFMDSTWERMERDLGPRINVCLCIICVEADVLVPWSLRGPLAVASQFCQPALRITGFDGWPWQDFWAVVEGCPVIAGYMFLFFCCLLIRKMEDWGAMGHGLLYFCILGGWWWMMFLHELRHCHPVIFFACNGGDYWWNDSLDPLCANLWPSIEAWGGEFGQSTVLKTDVYRDVYQISSESYHSSYWRTENDLPMTCQVWRFFTFTFFHLQFLDLFQNLLTLLDTLDVEAWFWRDFRFGYGHPMVDMWCDIHWHSFPKRPPVWFFQGTPPIILGDGSNLKCGAAWQQWLVWLPPKNIQKSLAHHLRLAQNKISCAIPASVLSSDRATQRTGIHGDHGTSFEVWDPRTPWECPWSVRPLGACAAPGWSSVMWLQAGQCSAVKGRSIEHGEANSATKAERDLLWPSYLSESRVPHSISWLIKIVFQIIWWPSLAINRGIPYTHVCSVCRYDFWRKNNRWCFTIDIYIPLNIPCIRWDFPTSHWANIPLNLT